MNNFRKIFICILLFFCNIFVSVDSFAAAKSFAICDNGDAFFNYSTAITDNEDPLPDNNASPAKKVSSAQSYIDEILKRDSLLNNAIVGIYAVNNSDKKIASWNNNFPMLTASTLKTITTGTALSILGSDYRFKTSISINGPIKGGTLYGNLAIIGEGDPTFGSTDTLAYNIDSLFGIWTDALKRRGIRKITGNIIADDSYFVREAIPSSWSWSNLGWYYGSAASGLSFMENTQKIVATPGIKVGDPISIDVVYPEFAGQKIINRAVTGAPGTGDMLDYYTSDMLKASRMQGSLAIDKGAVENILSNKYPHLSAAYAFLEYLNKNGIEVIAPSKIAGNSKSADAIIVDVIDMPENFAKGADTIASVYSPKLINIVNVTNRISNNFFAETLFKTIGKKLTGVGSIDSSATAIQRYLKGKGIDVTGYTPADGSGLSRMNYVSPEFFTEFYKMMQKEGCFNEYLSSFPYPGGPGTLKDVLRGAKYEKDRARIHAKSGSLSGVRCYAGYVESRSNGMIRFAILVNNYSVPTSKVQPLIEKFMWELTK